MSDKVVLPDDGTIILEFQGASLEIDAYDAANRIASISESLSAKPLYEFHEAVRSLLVDRYALPGTVTHRAASAFIDAINAKLAALKKTDSGASGDESPDSTASTASTSVP